jgi:2-dehydro-3-deoxygluconokinase
VKKAFSIAKDNGILTAYDPNFTSLISTPQEDREYFDEILPFTDILFMSSKYDTKNIFEIDSLEKIMTYMSDNGVKITIIKSSENNGYYLNNQYNTTFIPFYTNQTVDTTSSGDAFNGAFLHAYANSYTALEAAKIASIDAGLQAQGIGAIKSIPYAQEVYNIYKTEEL